MSARVLHAADLHIDADHHARDVPGSPLNSAWVSNHACGMTIAKAAVEHEVDAVIWAGDLFKNGRPGPEAYLLAREIITATAGAGIPTVLLRGNHELIGLRPGHRSALALFCDIPNVHVVEEPRLLTVGGGIQIACLPWPSKNRILTNLGLDGLAPSEGDARVAAWMAEAVEDMAEHADETAPLILAAHVTVDDVKLGDAVRGSEQDLTHVFDEPILPRAMIEDLPYAYAALGHIHDRQSIGTVCHYAGSPNRITRTDAGKHKGANLVTVNAQNNSAEIHLIETPARQMAVVNLGDADALDRIHALEPGTLTWITLEPGARDLPTTVHKALSAAGAHLVEARRVPAARDRARGAALAETASLPESIGAYLERRGVPAERHARYTSVAATFCGADQ